MENMSAIMIYHFLWGKNEVNRHILKEKEPVYTHCRNGVDLI